MWRVATGEGEASASVGRKEEGEHRKTIYVFIVKQPKLWLRLGRHPQCEIRHVLPFLPSFLPSFIISLRPQTLSVHQDFA